jgi:hypothetical protein
MFPWTTTANDVGFPENAGSRKFSAVGFTPNDMPHSYITYLDVKRVLKPGGRLLALHPGDHSGAELSALYPNLLEPVPEAPRSSI